MRGRASSNLDPSTGTLLMSLFLIVVILPYAHFFRRLLHLYMFPNFRRRLFMGQTFIRHLSPASFFPLFFYLYFSFYFEQFRRLM